MANFITGIRIVCSLALLGCNVFSPAFYLLYVLAGLSDMADGWVARRTDSVSEFGSKFDTLADILFVIVCLVKLLPVLKIPVWLYVCIGLIACIKVFNIAYAYVVHKTFVAVHTLTNKVAGFLLFLFPLTLSFIKLEYSAASVCLFAAFAAVKEGLAIKKTR